MRWIWLVPYCVIMFSASAKVVLSCTFLLPILLRIWSETIICSRCIFFFLNWPICGIQAEQIFFSCYQGFHVILDRFHWQSCKQDFFFISGCSILDICKKIQSYYNDLDGLNGLDLFTVNKTTRSGQNWEVRISSSRWIRNPVTTTCLSVYMV